MKELFKRIDLQLFAEDPAPEATPPEQAPEEEGAPGEPERKYSDEDVNRIISQKFAEWEKKQQKKARADAEAQRLANMNAEEMAQHEREQLEAQLRDLLAERDAAEMGKVARKMFADKGVTGIGDEIVARLIVPGSADQTKEAVEGFIAAFNDAVTAAVRDAMKGKTPKTGGSSGMTKEQIMGIKNRAERQRMISEHMELFNT